MALIRRLVIRVLWGSEYNNLNVDFCAKTNRYELSWWSPLWLGQEPPHGMDIRTRKELETPLRVVLDEMCQSHGVGGFRHGDFEKLAGLFED